MMIVESDGEWESKDCKAYKPYAEAPRHYDWQDYVKLSDDGQRVLSCHMCDIRRTGCMSPSTPRYYCKKDKKDIQVKLI